MIKFFVTSCAVIFSILAGKWGAAADDRPDFSNVLALLNEQHVLGPVVDDLPSSSAEVQGFDESSVDSERIMIPLTTVPQDGGTYCHSDELDTSERYIVGFNPIVESDDVSEISLYGCLKGPSSQDVEWQCSASGGDSVCEGPAVQMFRWERGGCAEERGELITIGGEYIKHVVLVVTYKQGGYESASGLELKLMSTDFKDTPGLTKSVEYYSSEFSYGSKCKPGADEHESTSSEGSQEGEDNELSDEVAEVESGVEEVEPLEANASVTTGDDDDVIDAVIDDDDVESSMTFYESSLPRYDSYSVTDYSAIDSEDSLVDSESIGIRAGYFVEPSESDVDSSIGALINYLADYFDSGFRDTTTLTSTGWWPRKDIPIGQIAGLDIDSMGHLVLIRRGERTWKPNDFDEDNVYLLDTPIPEQTLLVVDPMTGNIIEAWGKDRFYLPHGLTIDHNNNVWLTDVAMHQVFKFSSESDQPEMTFGEAFTPGSDVEHLCKPTDVVICPKSGAIFIADGYCNSRILKFDANGTFQFEINAHNEDSADVDSDLSRFQIPHSLAMVLSRGWICVADRENARIQCFDGHDGSFATEFKSPEFGREVFAIAYNPVDDVLYAVNGPQLHRTDVITSGFTIDIGSGEILDTWTPDPERFGILHDITVSRDDGAVFVADIENNRVWRFEKDSDVLSNMIY